MNIQALMKQAQSMQKDMQKQENGKKEILSITIENKDNLEKDDLEILEDMIMVALNNAFKKVDDLREQKMSKYTNMMPGLF